MTRGLSLLLLCQLSVFKLVTPGRVCGRPPLTDSMSHAGIQRVYEVGEELILSCKTGYTPTSGSRKVICTASGKWTQPTLKCEPKMCDSPGPLKNGVIQFTDISFKSVINYTCNEGYVLHGDNSSTCLEDGIWSHPLPLCEPVTCELPEIPQYGKIIYHKKFKGNTTEFGDSVTYECFPPYVLIGNERGFCTANGNWTELPECQFVTCPVPPPLENGFISFAVMREHGYDEKVKYGCKVDFILDGPTEVQCEKTGQWSTMPVCRSSCSVGIKRGRIFYNGKKIWIEDFNPNKIPHADLVVVYCKNKEKNCGYPVATQCIDGSLKIPDCYKEPSRTEYAIHSKRLPSEINMCV